MAYKGARLQWLFSHKKINLIVKNTTPYSLDCAMIGLLKEKGKSELHGKKGGKRSYPLPYLSTLTTKTWALLVLPHIWHGLENKS